MAKAMPLGAQGRVERVVERQNTLQNHLDWLPPVLSTPHMIGWMEVACFEAARAYCEDGEITVGTAIHVEHRAPAGIGSRVLAEAVLESIEGRFHIFRVSARDGERLLGEGTVTRAFVHVPRFLEKTGLGR